MSCKSLSKVGEALYRPEDWSETALPAKERSLGGDWFLACIGEGTQVDKRAICTQT